MVLGLSNFCLQLYFSLFCDLTCCCLFLSWGTTVLWQYSCGSCLEPSAHIVSFALEVQYGRSPLCFNGRLLAGLFSSQEMQAAVCRAGKYAREGGGTGRKKSPLSPSNVTHFVCVCVYMSVCECLLMWICTLLSDGALKAIVRLEQQAPVGQSDPTTGYLFVEVYKILPDVNVLFSQGGFNCLMKYLFFSKLSLSERALLIPHACLHVNVYASFPWSAFCKDFVNLNHYMFSSGDYSQCLYYSNATYALLQSISRAAGSTFLSSFFFFSFCCLLLCKSLWSDFSSMLQSL